MNGNAHDDLAVIRRLMEETRAEVVDRGKHFTIWGVISTVGLLATWGWVEGWWTPRPGPVWGFLLALGWGGSLVVGWRDSRGARVGTAGRRLLTGVWVTAAVSLTLVGMAGIFGGVLGDRALPGVLSAVIAVPIWMTAQLTGERWLGLVAGGWWGGAAVMLFVPGHYSLPMMAVMSLLLLAVPGVVLNARSGPRRGSAGAAVGGEA